MSNSARRLMNINKLISIRDSEERPAAEAAGYEYKASLRRLGLGGSYDDYFVNVNKPRTTDTKPPFGGSQCREKGYCQAARVGGLRPGSPRLQPLGKVGSLAVSLVLLVLLVGCESSGGSGEKVRLVVTPVATPTRTPPVPPTIGPTTYAVRPGDTLSGIASQFGLGVDDIVRANNIADPNTLAEGQALTIPAHSSGVTGTPGAEGSTPTVQATPALPPPDVTPPQGPTAQP